MKQQEKRLCELTTGEKGMIYAISSETPMRRRLMDIGCLVGEPVRMLGRGPFGDPCLYRICGAMIAIRKRDAAHILVKINTETME